MSSKSIRSWVASLLFLLMVLLILSFLARHQIPEKNKDIIVSIIGMIVNERNGKLIASFPAEETDEIMLVTNGGQLIRTPVQDISIMGRSTQGVIVFSTSEGEHVVSVEHIPEENGGEEG